jgi:hypothetical protein
MQQQQQQQQQQSKMYTRGALQALAGKKSRCNCKNNFITSNIIFAMHLLKELLALVV